jgi:hypothetical protein
MGRWVTFRVLLPVVLPVAVAWTMVDGLNDVLPSEKEAGENLPDWPALFASAKVLLIGLLLGIGAIRDLWVVRGAAPEASRHTVFFAAAAIVWGYALIKFAVVITREVFHLGPVSNIPVVPSVLTVVLSVIGGAAHWFLLSENHRTE